MTLRRLPGLSLVALVSMAVAACAPDAPANPSLPTTAERPPIVLISIDTLRSDHLPAYGYEGVETPAIDRLRRDAVLFEHAYSHAPLTLPSHASMFTGLTPDRHRVRDNQGYPLVSSEIYLPRLLKARGYATGGAVSAFVLSRKNGFDATGFDHFDDAIEEQTGVALGGISRPGGETLSAITPWIEEHAGRPFFLFLHLYEPHLPHDPPAEFADRFASPYDGEIAAADQVVGRLIDLLKQLGVYSKATVILVSDHGEGLGDHGEQEHGVFLYREALQVPLLLKLPGRLGAGSSVAATVQLVDLLPTVLDLIGSPRPADLNGISLAQPDRLATEPSQQPTEERAIYAETFYPRLHYGWSDLASIIVGSYHYIAGPDPELFDLEADPGERRNLADGERRRMAEMRRRLAAIDRSLEPPIAVDAEARSRLAALGYLGGVERAATASDGPLPDPKQRIASLAHLREAFEWFKSGRDPEAADAFERVLARNPGMVDAWEYLGLALRRSGRFEEAREAVRKAAALAPGEPRLLAEAARLEAELGDLDAAFNLLAEAEQRGADTTEVATVLGLALAEQGRLDEAQSVLEGAASQGHSGALAALALTHSEAGRQAAAEEILADLLAGDPDDAIAHEHLGLVRLRQGRWEESRRHSQQAVDLEPPRASAWNNLGVARFYLDDKAGALEAWQLALQHRPQRLDTLFNLGTRAAEMGRAEVARRALSRFIELAPPSTHGEELGRARVLLDRLGI